MLHASHASGPSNNGCIWLKVALALMLQVLVKKREDADDVLGLSAAKRGAKGKGKKGAAARVADKANVRSPSSWLRTAHMAGMISSPGMQWYVSFGVCPWGGTLESLGRCRAPLSRVWAFTYDLARQQASLADGARRHALGTCQGLQGWLRR